MFCEDIFIDNCVDMFVIILSTYVTIGFSYIDRLLPWLFFVFLILCVTFGCIFFLSKVVDNFERVLVYHNHLF